MYKRLPLIIDCDPGHDDAIMLMLAFGSKLFDIRAVTISAGNQTQDKTLLNALRVLTLIGVAPPVFRGCEKPLNRELIIAAYVHGASGIDGPMLPSPSFNPGDISAIAAIAQVLKNATEPVTIVATGPLTNIASFLLVFPELKSAVEKIVLMGGGITRGNYTPLAEFNMYVDPEAAAIVFESGIPIVMHGLDVTHKALFFADDITRFRMMGNQSGTVVADLVEFFSKFYRQHRPELNGGAALHDPCTIAWLINPNLFDSKPCFVAVETTGKLTTGATVVDFYNLLKKAPNAEVVFDVDRKGFVQLLYDAIKTLP